MFKNFNITMSPESKAFLKSAYESASNILEYGSGGSTIFAAAKGKTIVTTESDPFWLLELMGAYKEQKLPGDIIPIMSDIGKTKGFGHPQGEEKWKDWPSYALQAWQYCEENSINPDLVLIDGRYRVACFLACCINTTKPIRILFDDFANRKHYHVVTELIEPAQIIEERLAVFEIEPNMVHTQFLLQHIQYFYDPA